MKNENRKWLVRLHGMLALYSIGGIFSKRAAGVPFLSIPFCLYYGGVILLLAVYAFGWQKIIKHLPLTTAFANKAVTVVWGIVWGWLIFHEQITVGKLLGAALVIAGVVLFVLADREGSNG